MYPSTMNDEQKGIGWQEAPIHAKKHRDGLRVGNTRDGDIS